MAQDFEQNLDTYAELVVKVGINLQPGQRLIIGAPIMAAPFIRRVVAHAYQAGARLVDVMWSDQQLELIRLQHAPRDSFAEHSTWAVNGLIEFASRGDASLWVFANDPDLLSGQDPNAIATIQRTDAKVSEPFNHYIDRNAMNWVVIAVPLPGWADKVFADLPADQREERLWNTLFDICRVKQADAVAVWQRHIDELAARSASMTQQQFAALRLKGPGTNIQLGLPEGHIWHGGRAISERGVAFIPNMPTEEIFTMPHKAQTEGVITATKPLNHGGALIENFTLTFAHGRVVDITADRGAEILQKLIETDAGAGRLGEVALVPHSSPISQSGILFYNTLLDENASNHVALGSAYRFTMENGETMTGEEFAAAGGNESLIHVDFMIGSGEMDVDGVKKDGTTHPIMRNGEWAFEV